MPRVVYVNGRYTPYASARVHIDDRGYTFADGVYEVVAVSKGRFVDEEPHLERLDRSLRELRIAPPMSRKALRFVLSEVIRRNGVDTGLIYLQMSRGVAPRDHPFPKTAKTQFIAWAKTVKMPPAFADEGVKTITLPDLRWARCDIKSTSLLPNVLAKQAAREAGAHEAWLVDGDGFITEGSSTNAWIITRDGELITRALGNGILAGVTRRTVMKIAGDESLRVVERQFSVAEAKAAREAFLTSTTMQVLPVVQIDDQVIGNGQPGSLTVRLKEAYERYAE